MPTLRTAEFSVTRRDFFKVSFLYNLRRRWMIPALFFCVLFSMSGPVYALVFTGIYFAGLATAMWRGTVADSAAVFFRPKTMETDGQWLILEVEGTKTLQRRLTELARMEKLAGHYLLFFDERSMTILPASAFAGDEERKAFEEMLGIV